MGEAAKALGKGNGFFEVKGKLRELSPVTFDTLGGIERELERRAVEAVLRQKPFVDAETYQALLSGANDRAAEGCYSWSSPSFQRFLNTLPGKEAVLWRILEPLNPDLTREDLAEELAKRAEKSIDLAEVNRIVREAFLPNALAPESAE